MVIDGRVANETVTRTVVATKPVIYASPFLRRGSRGSSLPDARWVFIRSVADAARTGFARSRGPLPDKRHTG